MLDVDPDRLRQAVDNTLRNVRMHTPPGTTATAALAVDAHSATLTVADDGPGIPPDQRAAACERFRGDGKGTGLGLAITKAIVEHIGGALLLGETPGGGLSVTLRMPR